MLGINVGQATLDIKIGCTYGPHKSWLGKSSSEITSHSRFEKDNRKVQKNVIPFRPFTLPGYSPR